MEESPDGYLRPPSPEIRVMVADDHELIRSAVRQALRPADDIRVVAETADGESTLAALSTHTVDVLLLDMHMPKGDGLFVLDQLRELGHEVAVLILSVEENREVAVEALRRGATGYILKSIRPVDLASAVRQAANGNVYMGGPGLVGSLPPRPSSQVRSD
ncbi:MAG: hypothetical protein Kow00129_12730 [Thermoleophilia bacterium]